jgi:hypothetical protein
VVIVGGINAGAAVHPEGRETVANRNARSDEEKVVRVACVGAVFEAVEEVVNDQRPHDDRLPGPGGHLEADAGQPSGDAVGCIKVA